MSQLNHLVKLEMELRIRKFLTYSNLEGKNREQKMLLTERKNMVINSQKYTLRCSSLGGCDHEGSDLSRPAVSGGGASSVGYCHWCHPDFEPPAGVAVKPRGGSPTLPPQAVFLL